MLKRILAICVASFLSTNVFANGGTITPPPSCHVCTIYVGANISADFSSTEMTHQYKWTTLLSPSVIQLTHNKWDQGLEGVNGELYAGAGWLLASRFYVGGEIFGAITSQKGSRSIAYTSPFVSGGAGFLGFPAGTESIQTELKPEHTVGISFIPGIKVSRDSLLYGRVGVEDTSFKLTETTSTSNFFIPNFNVITPFGTQNFRKSVGGLQLGAGIQTMVTNTLGLRLEYDWNRYNTINHSIINRGTSFLIPGGLSTGLGTEVNTVTLRPTEQQVKLGLNFFFFS